MEVLIGDSVRSLNEETELANNESKSPLGTTVKYPFVQILYII